MCPPFHLKENVLKGILKEQLTFLEEYVGTITTNESLYCKVNKVRISQSNKPPKCWVVKGAITSPNHPRENIVLRRCQDQVNTGLPLCQINFRDTVRGMLFGRKLGSHCLDGAVQLFSLLLSGVALLFQRCCHLHQCSQAWLCVGEGKRSLSSLLLFFF